MKLYGRVAFAPLYLGLACLIAACTPAAQAETLASAHAAPARGAPLLWEIRSDKGRAWIYGTLHTGGANLVPQPAWDALAASTTFVMETDLDHVDEQAVIDRALLPADQSLDRLLSPAAWQRLVAAFAGKLPAAQLRRFKPWFVSVLLAQSLLPGGEATDEALKARASRQGAAFAYLETWQEQLDALEAGTDVAALELMLADLDKTRQQLDQLVDAYRAGDVDTIVKITVDPASGMSASALDKLLYARNRAWMPKIEALVAGGGAFIAVGAGHIAGPGGLVELLAARGYTVTRVPARAKAMP